jgi:competence protein ComFC
MSVDTCMSCGKWKASANRAHVVREWGKKLAHPSRYPIVYRLVDGLSLCASCLEHLPVIGETICQRCGRDLGMQCTGGDVCTDCTTAAEAESLQANRALLRYNQWGKDLLSRFKYRGDERLAEFYASVLLLAYYRYYGRERFQLVTYVPLHETRLAERGFNQVEILAGRVGRSIGVPVYSLLARTRRTAKLSRQGGRAARLESVEDAFTPRLDPALRPTRGVGKPILLIDDIYTTGSTLRSCAATLRSDPLWKTEKILSLTIYR